MKTLILSHRAWMQDVSTTTFYEFEDLLMRWTGAEMLQTQRRPGRQLLRQFLNRAGKALRLPTLAMAGEFQPLQIKQDYDLFFTILCNPRMVRSLNCVKGLRARCKRTVCYLIEVWDRDLDDWKNQASWEALRQFDHIFVAVHHPVERIAKVTGVNCSYLPMAADAVLFSPLPHPPFRWIDLCSIGRSSSAIHNTLYRLAQTGSFFYMYGTPKGSFEVGNHSEHRFLNAAMLKRSRYFLAHKANVNELWKTRGVEEFGQRFAEGAAAGTVMLGDYPKTSAFKEWFGWENPVLHVDFDCANIDEVIRGLDADPERCAKIRCDNARHGLLQHDWSDRWRRVLQTLNIPPSEALQQRFAQLDQLAAMCHPEFFRTAEAGTESCFKPMV